MKRTLDLRENIVNQTHLAKSRHGNGHETSAVYKRFVFHGNAGLLHLLNEHMTNVGTARALNHHLLELLPGLQTVLNSLDEIILSSIVIRSFAKQIHQHARTLHVR